MKKIILLVIMIMFVSVIFVYACDIVVGQTYNYEWKIINVATGAEISSGSGSIVPVTSQGYRNIEHYIRKNEFGWNSWTRTVKGVRERLTVTLADCDI